MILSNLRLVPFLLVASLMGCDPPPEYIRREPVAEGVQGNDDATPEVDTGDKNPDDDDDTADGDEPTPPKKEDPVSEEDPVVPQTPPPVLVLDGAKLFADSCAGCHTKQDLVGTGVKATLNAITVISVMNGLRAKFPVVNGSNTELEAISKFINNGVLVP